MMVGKIRVTGVTEPRIHDTSPKEQRLDPETIATALGAEPGSGVPVAENGSVSLATLRKALAQSLRSTGGRPGLSGVSRRVKIPIPDSEWERLEKLKRWLASSGYHPSTGQVASVLLSLVLDSVESNLSPSLAGELSRLTERVPVES